METGTIWVIYVLWYFLKSVTLTKAVHKPLMTLAERLFTRRQEFMCTNIEGCFGVLYRAFITSRIWVKIIKVCVIMHTMTINSKMKIYMEN